MTIAHETPSVIAIEKSHATSTSSAESDLILSLKKVETTEWLGEEELSLAQIDINHTAADDVVIETTEPLSSPPPNLALNKTDQRVDKVYTIGCFDLFHEGHIILLKRMRELGKQVIVGVHDSESIYKLKKRVPIDSTEKRMRNVKTYADEVFCIPSCDPSVFIGCIFNLSKCQKALYVRGDDMIDFPSRHLVETLMPIKFLPYTQGVSSTQIRKEKFAHIASNDENYLEYNR